MTEVTIKEVTIKIEITGCDEEIAEVVGQVAKIINFAGKTDNPGLALAIVSDSLSEFRRMKLPFIFQKSGITLE